MIVAQCRPALPDPGCEVGVLAQGGKFHDHRRQTIEKVFTEVAGGDQFLKISVTGSDHLALYRHFMMIS